MRRECLHCKYLSRCETVDATKVLEHYVCDFYEEVEKPAQIKARYDIINKFGNSGIQALLNPDIGEG